MQIDFLIENNSSISFFSPMLPNGGFAIDDCKDIEKTKSLIIEYFESIKIKAILKEVNKPTTIFIAGIHTI